MQTVQLQVYKFNELSEEVQEKILDDNRLIMVEYKDGMSLLSTNLKNH